MWFGPSGKVLILGSDGDSFNGVSENDEHKYHLSREEKVTWIILTLYLLTHVL